MLSGRGAIWCATGLLVIAMLMVSGCGDEGDASPATGSERNIGVAIQPMVAASNDEVGRAEAVARADQGSFELRMPDAPAAEAANLIGYTEDGSGVAMRFPPPTATSDGVRAPNITVWAGRWRGGDVEKFNAQDVAESDTQGLTECQVGDHSAVCVEPHSKDDVDHANPAFVRFVIDGTVYEVSGGDSLASVLEVARSLLDAPVIAARPTGT